MVSPTRVLRSDAAKKAFIAKVNAGTNTSLRKLAPELRTMIFEDVLQVMELKKLATNSRGYRRNIQTTPSLLLALRGDQDLYHEALAIYYKKQYFVLSKSNFEKIFRDISPLVFSQVRHLQLNLDEILAPEVDDTMASGFKAPSARSTRFHAFLQNPQLLNRFTRLRKLSIQTRNRDPNHPVTFLRTFKDVVNRLIEFDMKYLCDLNRPPGHNGCAWTLDGRAALKKVLGVEGLLDETGSTMALEFGAIYPVRYDGQIRTRVHVYRHKAAKGKTLKFTELEQDAERPEAEV